MGKSDTIVIKGSEGQLRKCIVQFGNWTRGDWLYRVVHNADDIDSSVFELRDKVSIMIDIKEKSITKGMISVVNIVPHHGSSISDDDYTKCLTKFYDEIIKPMNTGDFLSEMGDGFEISYLKG